VGHDGKTLRLAFLITAHSCSSPSMQKAAHDNLRSQGYRIMQNV